MRRHILTICFSIPFYFLNAQVADKLMVIGNEVTTNPAPSSFSQEVRFHVKWNASIGVPYVGSPGAGTYSALMTIAPWSDGSGSKFHQLNFNEDGLFWRKGTFGSSWEGWKRIISANENGNVAIGTTSASARLQIHGSGAGTTALSIIENPNSAAGAHFVSEGANNIKFQLRSTADNAVNTELRTWGNSYINSLYGNVGIGTANPGSFKLAVEGKIGAREVNVMLTNPWPDHVFEDNYELRSLADLAQYVEQYKHLPEVPTAAEVTKNGVNLGEMDAILLKKIEELTLHLIRQEKEINDLKSRVNEGRSAKR